MADFLFIAKDGAMDFGSAFNEARLRQHLKDNNGKTYRVELEISTRSLNQNKLYWLYLGIIERETGNNANDLHEYFRRTLLPPKFIKVLGKDIKIPKSTTELTKSNFSDYMDKISGLVDIPIPDTENYLQEIDLAPLK